MQDESCKDEESADVKLFLVQAFFEAGVAVFQAQVFLFEVDDCRLEFAVALVDGDGVAGGTLQGDEFVARFLFGGLQGFKAGFQRIQRLVLVVGGVLQVLCFALQLLELLLLFGEAAVDARGFHDAARRDPAVEFAGFDVDVVAVAVKHFDGFAGAQGAEEFGSARGFVVHGGAQFVADPGFLRAKGSANAADEGEQHGAFFQNRLLLISSHCRHSVFFCVMSLRTV